MADISYEVFRDIVSTRLDRQQEALASLSKSHLELGNALLDHIRLVKGYDKEIQRLVDDLSMIHGKIIALKD